MQKAGDYNEFQPALCLDQLFQSDIDLVSKVRATFGDAPLVIIGRRGSAAADELPGDVPPCASVGERIHNLCHAGGEMPKSI